MNLLQAIILGALQGFTEFLPISSSAHLVLVPFYAGWDIDALQNVPFYVMVHFGTLIAVLTYFRKDITVLARAFTKSIFERSIGDDPYRRLAWFVIIGTLPTGIVYVLIHKLLENALESPTLVSIFLLVTGVLLVTSELLGNRSATAREMRLSDVLFVGFAQGLAILPGISRSGSTIAAGLFRGLTRDESARFSFLLSIPVIIAGTIEELKPIIEGNASHNELIVLVVGFIAASITGYFAIKYFMNYLRKHSLYVFALYCFALGIITLFASSFK